MKTNSPEDIPRDPTPAAGAPRSAMNETTSTALTQPDGLYIRPHVPLLRWKRVARTSSVSALFIAAAVR